MADRYHNPFQGIDIRVPKTYHADIERYSQREAHSILDQSPFRRMIDLWFLAVCVAARMDSDPVDISKYDTVKIIEGSIFGSDPWRIHTLMFVAIAKTGDVRVVSEPRRMMTVINGLAVAGLPKIIEMLKEGSGEPIWNLTDAIHMLLTNNQVK